MNDPNKVINVNLSSILSLKAELLRKQSEVNKAKSARSTADDYMTIKGNPLPSAENTSKRHGKKHEKKDRARENSKTESATACEYEDSALLEKSKRVLEAKSKFYERMSKAGGKLNSDDNCLVLFNRKRQEELENEVHESNVNDTHSDDDVSSTSSDDCDKSQAHIDEQWVEYTDCLGRTRKCLRKDLEDCKKRDAELAASMPERLDQSKANWMLDVKVDKDDYKTQIGPLPPASLYADGSSIMSKHDEQRVNWERKEQENFDKPDVHYQDVFFDEARQHGVGYYRFSTDEEERKRQQRELLDAREQTISEQERRDALRAQREKIIAERVRAAKNRQRARLGLPPLEEITDESKTNEEEKVKETKEERKERKRVEKLKRKQQKEEEQRELERQEYVRPWDETKEGVKKSKPANSAESFVASATDWKFKADRQPLSQEEWNERQREQRRPEFAPVPEPMPPPLKRTNFSSMPPPDAYYDYTAEPRSKFNSFQTTKRDKVFRKRNYDAVSQCSNEDTEENDSDPSRKRAAIPPPVDLDYTTPSYMKRSKNTTELERSIEAGLQFLRNNCDKDTKLNKANWVAKADY